MADKINKVYKEARKVGQVAALVILPLAYITLANPAAGIGIAAAGATSIFLMYVLPKGGVKGALLYAA